jgi:isoleucyl-tRNA synthetase
MTDLQNAKRCLSQGRIKHSYPFCWRSETPLIYRPVKSWFIRVESFKDDLLENNMKARWVPSFV